MNFGRSKKENLDLKRWNLPYLYENLKKDLSNFHGTVKSLYNESSLSAAKIRMNRDKEAPLFHNLSEAIRNDMQIEMNLRNNTKFYLESQRFISPGEFLLQTPPSIIFPNFFNDRLENNRIFTKTKRREILDIREDKEPNFWICSGCFENIIHFNYHCNECRMPLCSEECKNNGFWHKNECKIFQRINHVDTRSYLDMSLIYMDISITRILLYKEHESLEEIYLLKKLEEDRDIVEFLENSSEILQFEREYIHKMQLSLKVSKGNIQMIKEAFAILSTKAFNFKSNENAYMISPFVSYIQHSCFPNSMMYLNTNSRPWNIEIWSIREITKGETITIDFLQDIFLPTIGRQCVLWQRFRIKECNCTRCSDPSELGTYFGSPICPKCEKGFLVKIEPLKLNSEWACNNIDYINENEEEDTDEERNIMCKYSCELSNILKEEEKFWNTIKSLDNLIINKDFAIFYNETKKEIEKCFHKNHYLNFLLMEKFSLFLPTLEQKYEDLGLDFRKIKLIIQLEFAKRMNEYYNFDRESMARIKGYWLYKYISMQYELKNLYPVDNLNRRNKEIIFKVYQVLKPYNKALKYLSLYRFYEDEDIMLNMIKEFNKSTPDNLVKGYRTELIKEILRAIKEKRKHPCLKPRKGKVSGSISLPARLHRLSHLPTDPMMLMKSLTKDKLLNCMHLLSPDVAGRIAGINEYTGEIKFKDSQNLLLNDAKECKLLEREVMSQIYEGHFRSEAKIKRSTSTPNIKFGKKLDKYKKY